MLINGLGSLQSTCHTICLDGILACNGMCQSFSNASKNGLLVICCFRVTINREGGESMRVRIRRLRREMGKEEKDKEWQNNLKVVVSLGRNWAASTRGRRMSHHRATIPTGITTT